MATANFECARHSVVSSVYHRAHDGWARRKTFKMEVLRRLENAIFRFACAITVNASSSVVQALRRFQLFKNLPDLDDEMTQFYLNFLKLQKLVGVPYPHPWLLRPW